MNGPRVVCVGCGAPTSFLKPVCAACIAAAGGTPVEPCLLCEQGYRLDAHGVLHLTKAGGYAGKCTAVPVAAA